MELTEKQKKDWDDWFSKLPENVKPIVEKIAPWKTYRLKNHDDIGSRYVPIEYNEGMNGKVTITCAKFNKIMPILGGYSVFGMKPEDLIECT